MVADSSSGVHQVQDQETETALKLVQFQNKALRDRLRSTAAENERLHEMLKEYRSAPADEVRAVRAGKEEDAEGQQGRIKELEGQISILRGTIESMESESKELVGQHEKEVEDMRAKHRKEAEMAERMYQGQLAHVQTEVEEITAKLHSAQDELIRVLNERDRLQEELCGLQEQILGESATQGLLKDKDANIGSLEAELAESLESLSKMKSNVESLEKELSSKNEDIERVKLQLKDALNSQTSAPVECTKSSQMESLASEQERLIQEVSSAIQIAMVSDAAKDELSSKYESARASWMGEKSKLAAAVQTLEADVASKQREIKSLKEDLANQNASAGAVQTDASLKQAQETISNLEGALEKERTQFQAYTQGTEEKLSKLESIISSGSRAVEELQKLRSEVNEKELKLKSVQEEFAAYKNKHPEEQEVSSKFDSEAPSYDIIMGDSIISLKNTIKELEAALEDSEKTHQLRDKATNVLKEEVEELKRNQKRNAVDVDYLKAVLVKSFACGELDSRSSIFDVIARLLHFSPQDLELAKKSQQQSNELISVTEILDKIPSLATFLPSSTT